MSLYGKRMLQQEVNINLNIQSNANIGERDTV